MNHNKKVKHTIKHIAFLTLILLLACVMIFIVLKNIFNIQKNIILSNETTMFASRINTRITEEQVHLRSLSEKFGKLTIPGTADAQKLLSITSSASNLDRIFAADSNGDYANDSTISNIKDKPYFLIAAEGTDYVESYGTGKTRNVVFSSPIFSGNKLTGVMVGTVDTHKGSTNFLSNTFNGNGSGFLVNSNGDIIVESYGTSSATQVDNILSFIRKDTLNPRQADEMLARMAKHESGALNLILDGIEISGFYAPVGLNGWYAVGLDFGVLSAQGASDINTIMFYFIAVFALLYIIYILVITKANRKSSERLSKAKGDFEMLVTNVNSGVVKSYFRDNPWEITPHYVSEQFTKLFGYDKESFNGTNIQTFVDLIDARDRERIVVEFAGQSNFDNYYFEYRIKAADGTIHYVTDKGSVIHYPLGENKLLSVITDVTDQVVIKNELEICERSLSVANELSSTTVFEVDLRKGQYVRFNNCNDLLGYSEQTILKMLNDANSDTALNIIYHPDDLDYAQEMRALLYKDKRAQYTARMRNSEGSFVWCRITTILFLNIDGEPVRILGHLLNIEKVKFHDNSLVIENEIDASTGFLNATAFNRHVTRGMSAIQNGNFTLMVAQISPSKPNGDIKKAIEIAREIIKNNADPHDILGSLEYNRFSVLMSDVSSLQGAQKAAETFIKEFEQKAGLEYSINLGLALSPFNTLPAKVIRITENALAKSTDQGKNQYCILEVFDSD